MLILTWLTGWTTVSAIAVWVLNNEPSDDRRIQDLEDQQPLLVAGLLIAWPFVLFGMMVELFRLAWQSVRGNTRG
jgi:hypothetical protein